MKAVGNRTGGAAGAAALTVAGMLLFGVAGGCGGGSGSSGSSGASRAATVNLYVTDGFRDEWSQVLVTLYKIEASTDGGKTYTTLYENASGQSVDLASLGQAAQLLSSVSIPSASGNITTVRVTLGDTISLTAAADGSVKTVTVDSSLPNVIVSNGQAAFTFQAPTSLSAGKLSNLVVDFNLAAFELLSGKVRPSLGAGDPSAFEGKQKVAHLTGTVSNYVAGSGFDLTPNCGQHDAGGGASGSSAGTPSTVHVTLTSATTITAGDSSGDGTSALADGVTVSVEGSTDATTGAVTATVVHVRDSSDTDSSGTGTSDTAPRPAQALGAVASLGSDGTSFTLTVRDGEHLSAAPAGTLTVQTSASTTFLQGKTTATFAAVAAGSYVFVSGTLDPATETLTAKTVAVLPAAPSGGEWPGGH